MRYTEFRDTIANELRRCPQGLTWVELRDGLDLPSDTPCPTWVRRLEDEIGLARTRESGGQRGLVWRVANPPAEP